MKCLLDEVYNRGRVAKNNDWKSFGVVCCRIEPYQQAMGMYFSQNKKGGYFFFEPCHLHFIARNRDFCYIWLSGIVYLLNICFSPCKFFQIVWTMSLTFYCLEPWFLLYLTAWNCVSFKYLFLTMHRAFIPLNLLTAKIKIFLSLH